MELHAEDRPLPVPQRHENAAGVVGGGKQFRRQAVGLHHQRMVAGGGEAVLYAGEQAVAVMVDAVELAMHRLRRAHDASAERLRHHLAAQADAENGNAAAALAHQLQADAGVVGILRPGRENHRVRGKGGNLGGAHGVVARHLGFQPQLGEQMHQIVGETVVIVDQQQHGVTSLNDPPFYHNQPVFARWMARSRMVGLRPVRGFCGSQRRRMSRKRASSAS